MRNFVIGLCVGVVLATGLTAWAQVVPFDAPLREQLQGQMMQNTLRIERGIERMEQGLYRDPLLSDRPCR